MKKKLIILAMTAVVASLGAISAQAVTINYSSTPGSDINFTGSGHFDFTPSSDSFHITSGSANGLLGDMSGTYTIGSVTTSSGVSSASVSGSGVLTIHDGVNDLTGTLTWVNIVQVGTGSTLNTVGNVNLTGVSYSGSNADLLALANAGNAADVLTFQFTPAIALSKLIDGNYSTSFSGSISTVPDGGMTAMLLGAALSALGLFRKKLMA